MVILAIVEITIILMLIKLQMAKLTIASLFGFCKQPINTRLYHKGVNSIQLNNHIKLIAA